MNNFRFNESPVELLGRITEVGAAELTLCREWNDFFTRTVMPPIRVPDFNMSTVSQASWHVDPGRLFARRNSDCSRRSVRSPAVGRPAPAWDDIDGSTFSRAAGEDMVGSGIRSLDPAIGSGTDVTAGRRR